MTLELERWPLVPLAAAFGAAAAVRARWTGPGVRLDGPVLSVGNLAVGGSGKTPIVAHIATLLRDHGARVAVLSRGYGGSFRGDALVVADGERIRATAEEAGDEPLMLARAVPGIVVAVGPRRDVVGRHVESKLGPRVHLLDDGFQHHRLARDLDVVCLLPKDLADWPLPAGRLREFPGALRRAHLILIAGDGYPDELLTPSVSRLGRDRTFLWRREPLGFFTFDGAAHPAPTRAYLLSGIARSERFARDVGLSVGALAGHEARGDHYRYTAADLDHVARHARSRQADAVVTTAKDAERLRSLPWRSDLPLLVYRFHVSIDDAPRFHDRVFAAAKVPS